MLILSEFTRSNNKKKFNAVPPSARGTLAANEKLNNVGDGAPGLADVHEKKRHVSEWVHHDECMK